MNSPTTSSLRSQQELASLPIPGGWSWKSEQIGERPVQLLLPADGHAFLDDESNGEWPDPFWTQIWPAARSLAAVVAAQPWQPGIKVLELGCGNGFLGLAALLRGCQVTFSDYVPLAVELAVANATANGYADSRGCVLDWRNPRADEPYDVVLAADVLYDPELHYDLLTTLAQVVSPTGYVWLGDPGRETVEPFASLARERGWQVNLRNGDFNSLSNAILNEFCLIELRKR